jgi:hypothetical protein
MSSERPAHPQRERPLPGDGAPAGDDRTAHPGPAGAGEEVGVALRSTPRPSNRCVAQVVEGEVVLLDLHGRQLVGLNRVGSFVFGLLDGVRTVSALAAAVAERFAVEPDRAERDVAAFLVEMRRRGFVDADGPP